MRHQSPAVPEPDLAHEMGVRVFRQQIRSFRKSCSSLYELNNQGLNGHDVPMPENTTGSKHRHPDKFLCRVAERDNFDAVVVLVGLEKSFDLPEILGPADFDGKGFVANLVDAAQAA